MNVSGWWKKNVEKWACRATISSPDKYPGQGLRLLASLPPHHAFLPQTLMM